MASKGAKVSRVGLQCDSSNQASRWWTALFGPEDHAQSVWVPHTSLAHILGTELNYLNRN